MASLDDIAELIQRHPAERIFDSELQKLRLAYGDRVIGRALELAGRQAGARDAISIAASRQRHEARRAIERRAQRAFRQQHDDEPKLDSPSSLNSPPSASNNGIIFCS